MRRLRWISGGAASAVACKLDVAAHGLDAGSLVYIDTGAEHDDTVRFLADLEVWFDAPIERVRSERFADTWAVWEGERFLRGPGGAPCTRALKRFVRAAIERPDDVQIFGFTAEEHRRADTFRKHHYGEIVVATPLIEQQVSKADCYAIIDRAGIVLPTPYLLGFDNNNCIPCVKAEGAKYWNRIRRHFPDKFERMAKLERELGYALVRIAKRPVFLDELDPMAGHDDDAPEPMSCGITCFIAEANMTPSGHSRDCDWHQDQNPHECTCALSDGAGHGTASTTDRRPSTRDHNQNLPTGRDGEQ